MTAQPTTTPRNYKRAFIFARDGYKCAYCAGSLPPEDLTIDHKIPRVAGGSNHPDNLVTACKTCNFGKGSKMPSGIRVYRTRLSPPVIRFVVPYDWDASLAIETLPAMAAVRDSKLCSRDKLVLSCLMSRCKPIKDQGWTCFPSIATIALDTSMSTATVQASLKALVQWGLVIRDSGNATTSNTYVLDYGRILTLYKYEKKQKKERTLRRN